MATLSHCQISKLYMCNLFSCRAVPCPFLYQCQVMPHFSPPRGVGLGPGHAPSPHGAKSRLSHVPSPTPPMKSSQSPFPSLPPTPLCLARWYPDRGQWPDWALPIWPVGQKGWAPLVYARAVQLHRGINL